MISIVICSINENYLLQVKENISSSIGVEYELLIWDNRHDCNGICEVYNKMAKQARFEYVCFLHEDILFETMNWGHKISSIFLKYPDIGVIGVAGSKYKSGYYSGWYSGIGDFDCANIIHRYDWGNEHIYLNPVAGSALVQVVCIDGVFICCRKSMWDKIGFDENNLTGFHFYDIDFGIRASRICKVAVSFEILLTHITKGGDFGDNWVTTAINYHLLWKKNLPAHTGVALPAKTDIRIIKTWLDLLKNYRITWRNKWKWITMQRLAGVPALFYPIAKFLLYKPLGLRKIHKRGTQK